MLFCLNAEIALAKPPIELDLFVVVVIESICDSTFFFAETEPSVIVFATLLEHSSLENFEVFFTPRIRRISPMTPILNRESF